VIIPVITTPWAQWSMDSMKDDGFGTSGNAPLAHVGIQIGNVVAHTSMPFYLTRMSNPHIMSYAYKGLDPMRFGLKAAMSSRKEFQMMSSQAYRLGAKIGEHIAWPTKHPVFLPGSKQGQAALKSMRKGARIGGRVGFRAIPGLGWAMLAYDVYDLIANDRLFGVNL